MLEEARTLIARASYQEAIDILVGLRQREEAELPPPLALQLHLYLATAQIEVGGLDAALASLDRADVAAETARVVEAPDLDILRGSVWRRRGSPLQAIPHYQRALEAAERLGDRDHVVQALLQLSAAHQELGDWGRVLDFAERAFEREPDPTERQRFAYLIQRGIASYEFGERDAAHQSFTEALGLANESGDRRSQSLAWGELGLVAWELDRREAAALDAYERAVDLARTAGVPLLEASWLINAGNVLRDTGELEAALERYRASLAVAERFDLERLRVFALKNIGQVLAGLGRREEARRFLEQGLEEADRHEVQKIQWQARMELAALVSDDDPSRARELYVASLDLLEAHHASVLLERFRLGALGSALERYDPYDGYIRFLMDRGETDAAFEVAERARARVFLETMASLRSALAADLSTEYLESESGLLQEISAAQAALREPDVDAGRRRELLQSIEKDEDALAVLRLRLAIERPSLAHARYPHLVGPAELRGDLLAPGEVLAMYFLGRDRSWCWLVDRSASRAVPLPPRGEIEAAVRLYREGLSAPGASPDPAAEAMLWTALVEPLRDRLGSGSHLVVVPHGALHYLPFEALRSPEGRYLIEDADVSYVPSTSSFAYLRTAAPVGVRRERGVVAIGNPVTAAGRAAAERQTPIGWVGRLKPLPHSAAELRRIASVFGGRAHVLEQHEATESALAAADLERAAILHFATHALIDERRPERSGLALTAEPPVSDGVLQVREIYGLRLGGGLVTLSACETALGREITGEGMIGLTRAFFYAGANAVAASLWNVNDAAAAELMGRFYAGVRRREPLDRALGDAKRAFLRGGTTAAHPYYWAPFVLVGNARTDVAVGAGAGVTGPLLALTAATAAAAVAVLLLIRARRRRTNEARSRP